MAAVLTLDAELVIRSASQTVTVLFGYTDPEEFIGKPLMNILSPPSFLDAHKSKAFRRRRKLPCTTCPVVGWRKDGSLLSLQLSISELKVGEDLCYCCLLEKRKDKACLMTIDGTKRIISCNKHAARVFGRHKVDVIGQNLSAFCANFPVDLNSFKPRFSDSLHPTIIAPAEKKILRGIKGKHQDGTEVTLRIDLTARKHPTDPSTFILHINPIDEKQDPYIIVNKHGTIQRANVAACKMFGYIEKQLVGAEVGKLMARPPSSMKEFCDLFHRQYNVLSPMAMRKGCPSPKEWMRVVRARHRDGSYFYVYLELNEMREAGETNFLVKISHAMHEPKDSLGPVMMQNSRHVGNYVLQDTIIDGLYGKVKVAVHKLTNEKVVVKIIEQEKVDKKRFREIDLMKSLNHPNIVKMLEVLEAPERQYIILDMIEGGELYNHLLDKGHLSEEEARKYWRQLVSAVDYMHSKQIAHRDLKLENLMLDEEGNLVVIDFGLGNFMTPGKLMKTFCGSVAYAAPEMFLCQSYIGSAADIWSMGVILYSLVMGFLPYEDPRRIIQADYIPLNDASNPSHSVSPEFADLISKIFQKEATNRIKMADICEHPWTTKGFDTPLPCLSHQIEQAQPIQQAQQDQAQQPQPLQQTQHVHHAQHVQHAHHESEIVLQMKEFGFAASFVMKSIETNEMNPITATYHLLIKQKRRTTAIRSQSF